MREAMTVACGETGLLPPDGVHLILPQSGKILWTVGPFWNTSPKHKWVEPWPDVDKVRHILQPYFDATANVHVERLDEGSWNRSWIVTVLSDGPVPWSSKATHAKVETTNPTEARNTNENRHEEMNVALCEGASLGDSNCSSTVHRFVMRIASPVYPWFKVEAEVATMAYVRRHSATIPVPRVFLYDSSSTRQGNTLGYEWILMEYMPGIDFHKAAHAMTLPQKLQLAQTLADWEDELSKLRFPAIGSIYFTKSIANKAAVSAVPGSGSLLHSWRLCDHDPDFCVGPPVMQDFLGDWRLSYPFFKGPFDDEGEFARSLVACRKLEASDRLQSIRSKLEAHDDLIENLKERAEKLQKRQEQQDCPPFTAINALAQGESDELAQIRDDINAAERAVCRLRACAADEASTRGLPTEHVDMEGPSRFQTADGNQMSISELQHPSLGRWENHLDQSAAGSEILEEAVNKLWPPKRTKTPFAGHDLTEPAKSFSNLSLAEAPRLPTPPNEDTEQSYFEKTEYTLHHWDISSHNVLVDPGSGKPVALLDWEQIYTTSALTRGYEWYPSLMYDTRIASTWFIANSVYADSEHRKKERQQDLETRKMRKEYLARLKARESPLLDGFIPLCAHLSDRVQAYYERHELGHGGQGEDDASDDACSCADSDKDSDEGSDDENAQPSAGLNNPQGLEEARIKRANQLDRARRVAAVGVLNEVCRDKYFRSSSQARLDRVRKYFG